MGNGETIDVHNDQLPYVETSAPPQATGVFTAAWRADGRTVTVAGPCPACGGRTATDFAPGIGGTKGIRETRSAAALELRSPLTLYCECGHAHADRPADAIDKGCGRYWEANLTDGERKPPVSGPTAP